MKISKINRLLVNGIILCVTSYFILQKLMNISFSKFLDSILQPNISLILLRILYVIISYAIVVRLVLYVIDFFSKSEHITLQSPHQVCLNKCNLEIDKHLKELFDGKFSLALMAQKHTYEENLQSLHQNMEDHFKIALKTDGLTSENLFISVFHDPTFSPSINKITKLEYVSHFNPVVHDTHTHELDINEKSTKDFAGVKAFKTNKTVLYSSIKKGNYIKGTTERRKTLTHYIGIPLRIMGMPVAILNIEFHNKHYFKNNKDLMNFFRKEVQAFVYMYEYQIHKKYFFHHLCARVAN